MFEPDGGHCIVAFRGSSDDCVAKAFSCKTWRYHDELERHCVGGQYASNPKHRQSADQSRCGKPNPMAQEIQESELARANVIYVGAFNNSWTLNLNRNLRFAFEENDTPTGHVWMIRDRSGAGRNWAMTKTYPQPVDHDYALITRILDKDRNRVVISIGGVQSIRLPGCR